jgi:hypothetical protein
MSLGIRSGRELHAPKIERERLAERAHEQRLAEPRHAFEQAVAAREQADQQLLHDLPLADDQARDLLAHARELVEFARDLLFGRRFRRIRHRSRY